MTIGAICNREVITVQRDATVLHAAMLMRQYHVGDVVVIENRKDITAPIGIVTDRDVVIEVVATERYCRHYCRRHHGSQPRRGKGIAWACWYQLMTGKGKGDAYPLLMTAEA